MEPRREAMKEVKYAVRSRRRGQATAIGAVFFIMLVTVSLAYFIWSIEVMREMEHEYLSRRAQRAAVENEKLCIKEVRYVDWEAQAAGSVTVVEGEVISQSPFVVTSKCYYPLEELEVVMLRDDFEDPSSTGWTYESLIESCPINLQNGTCSSQCPGEQCLCAYSDREYMGTMLDIMCSGAGFTQTKYWSGAWGNYIYVKGYKPVKTYAYIDYIINNSALDAKNCNTDFAVSLFLNITSPSGIRKSILVASCSGTLKPDEEYACSEEWHELNLTEIFKEEGIYKINITSFYVLSFKPKGKSNIACAYNGLVLLNRTLIVAQSEIPLGPNSCRVIIDSEYDVPDNAVGGAVTLNGSISSTYADLTIMSKVLAYDAGLSAWREMSVFSLVQGSKFKILSSIDPLDRYMVDGTTRTRLIVEAPKPFNLTLFENLVNYSVLSNNVNVTVVNTCGQVVKIVRVWVVNSTDVMYRDVDAMLRPGEETTLTLDNIRLEKGSSYLVRVVTERGRMYDEVVRVPGG